MKLINSVNESRYKKFDTLFISDYKWEFLADKYRIIADMDIWEELEEECRSDDDYTSVLYCDVNGYSCLDMLQSDLNYADIERLLKHGTIILYTNKDKDFHILVQADY